MGKPTKAASETELQTLTADALAADNAASEAKNKSRLAKAKLKTTKKEFKNSKAAFKAAKKMARKAAQEARRTRQALERSLDRVAEDKKDERRRSAASKVGDGPVRRTAVIRAKHPASAELSANSG